MSICVFLIFFFIFPNLFFFVAKLLSIFYEPPFFPDFMPNSQYFNMLKH